VPDFCTCGAQLPPDARFCHKCGKPQTESAVLEDTTSESQPVLARAKAAPKGEINFRNRTAVRIGLIAAVITFLLVNIPFPEYLRLIWALVLQISAGFLAVYLYRRKTGEELSARLGARMGWITGVFWFVIFTVFFTINTLAEVSGNGGFAGRLREQLRTQGMGSDAEIDRVIAMLESPAGVVVVLFFTLFVLFFYFTLLPTLGGAMGAKVLEKER
jgi:hypothetical protein